MFVELCRQEDRCGCGVACLAMLTHRSYSEALALVRRFMGASYDPKRKGIETKFMCALLQREGLFIRTVLQSNPWPPRPFASAHLCTVKNPGMGHFVVMLEDGRIFDPLDGSSHKQLKHWPVVYDVTGVLYA